MSIFGFAPTQQTVVNPSKDRRLPGKKRVRARRQTNRASGVLGPTPSTHRPDVASAPTPVPVARYGLRELEAKGVHSLKSLAKELGLKGYSKLKKDELVEFIYRSPENVD